VHSQHYSALSEFSITCPIIAIVYPIAILYPNLYDNNTTATPLDKPRSREMGRVV
jgi:hypothetical protein